MTGYKPPYQVEFDQTDNYKTVNIFYVQLAYLTQAEIWLLTRQFNYENTTPIQLWIKKSISLVVYKRGFKYYFCQI